MTDAPGPRRPRSNVGTARQDLLERAVTWFAEHGVGDTSLRTLASALGTSHRMLNYHFGSREGLLAAAMEFVEQGERDILAGLLASSEDPIAAGLTFWQHIADTAETFSPLYFELSGHAMLRRPYAESLRQWHAAGWIDAFTDLYADAGATPEQARSLARMSLAQARGLLFELALTGDRPTADRAMEDFVELLRTRLGGARS